MTPNSLVVLKSCILDKNYVTVMHVPLSTPTENTFSTKEHHIAHAAPGCRYDQGVEDLLQKEVAAA